MRIFKTYYENADEDDVQIIYESPADEDCQFIEERVVNRPPNQSLTASKASCSRTSVIAGQKRPATDPLSPSRKNAGVKRPALQANFAESLIQPTTSQQSSESSIQDSSVRQQPSNSGQTTVAEQLPLDSFRQDSNSATTAVMSVQPVCIFMPSGGKPIRILSENEMQPSCSSSSSLGETNFPRKDDSLARRIQKIMHMQRRRAHSIAQTIQEINNVTSDNISPAAINQQEELEHNYSQRTQHQPVTMATQPSNPSVEESNIANDYNIPSPALVSQRRAFEQFNPQLQATSTHSNAVAIPSTSTASDNIPAHENQALAQYSQEAEQRSLNMIAQLNLHTIQESSLASDNSIRSRALMRQHRAIFEYDSQESQQEEMSPSEDCSSDEDEERSIREQHRYFADYIYQRQLKLNAQKKEQQAMGSTTQHNIQAIRESANVTNDHEIHSLALMNHQHDSQETQQPTISSTTQPIQESINIASNNDNSSDELVSQQLLNQQQQPLEQNSREAEQQTISMTTQPNVHEIQESVSVANDRNVESRALANRQGPIEQHNSQKPQQQAMSSTSQPNINITQENIVTRDTRPLRLLQLLNLQRQTTSSIPNRNIDQIDNTTSDNNAILRNQTGQSTTPLDLTQAGDLLVPTSQQGIDISSSYMMKEQQHLVWKGTIECRKKINGALISMSLPLKCSIYGIKTANGNMNVNADLWPIHLTLQLLPRHIILKQDLFKELNSVNRHAIIRFDVESKFVNDLQKSLCSGWMGCIQFPRPCHMDMMSVLYMPQQQVYIGFITNNESGFITKFTQVCRELDMEEQQNYQPAINTFETIDKDIDAYISLLHLQQRFLSSSSNQAQARPQQTSLPQSAHQQTSLSRSPSQQTSLPLPAHQQSNLSQFPHQYITLPQASHQQTSLPLASHPPTSLPLASHPQPSLPLASHPQTSLPLASHPQPSMPLASHPQPSMPLASHPQTSSPQCSCQPICLPQCSCQPICLPQCSHQQTSLPLCSHHQAILPQCSHQQTSLPQSSHQQTNLPQSSHQQTNLPQSLHQQTSLPQPSQSLINLFRIADSLQEQVIANKYETVDRHIDACISALRQRNQSSQGAGPSTSKQTPIQIRRLQMEQLLRERRQDSGTSNESLLRTSGASNSLATNLSQDPTPVSAKRVESQASEIFHPSLVKKVAKKNIKITGKSFKSVHELCEAILEYEESKRKCKEARKSKREVNEALLCKICMDEQMNVVFEPCGHLSTCLECSQPLEKCPMCRTAIIKKRKIYMS